MLWRRPDRRALIAAATVVAALLPISLIAAVSAFAGDSARPGNTAGPAIVGFSPQEGPIGGGTVVQISGGGFENITGVSFGTPSRGVVRDQIAERDRGGGPGGRAGAEHAAPRRSGERHRNQQS